MHIIFICQTSLEVLFDTWDWMDNAVIFHAFPSNMLPNIHSAINDLLLGKHLNSAATASACGTFKTNKTKTFYDAIVFGTMYCDMYDALYKNFWYA